jgi:zinc protease
MRWNAVMGVTLLFGIFATHGAATAAAVSLPPVDRKELDNGIRLLVIRQPHLPMVVVSALVDAGSRFDPVGKEGLANLTVSLLTEGTAQRSAAEIHDAVDFLGAKLAGGAGDDYASVGFTILKKDLTQGFDLFSDVLLHPKFPKDEFARKRDEALAELESEEQNPGALADRAFRKTLHGSGPYRAEPGGWKESVAKLSLADIKGFYRSTYRPDRTIVVASGDVTIDEMEELVHAKLGDWKGEGTGAKLPPTSPPPAPEVIRINRELTQTNLIWGHLGTTRDNPDWYAIQVMNYILGGGGFSSRMMNSIRIEAGLAYSVASYFVPGKLPGSFQAVLQTKSASTAEALRRLRAEVDRIREDEVSDEEISSAKRYLTGSFPLRFDSDAEMVSFFSQIEFYGLGLDYPSRYDDLINSVTKADILRVAKKYIHPEEALLVLVGKQSEIHISDKDSSGKSDKDSPGKED